MVWRNQGSFTSDGLPKVLLQCSGRVWNGAKISCSPSLYPSRDFPDEAMGKAATANMMHPCRKVEHVVNENHFMKELDFAEPQDVEAFGYVNTVSQTGMKRRYWSSGLLGDLLAVAAPVVPTIM